MWKFGLSCLRMFVFTPVIFVMAVSGILVCILQDLISFLFKLIWRKVIYEIVRLVF
jgi:hypothetical protein